ncbi:alpha/beta hydrolase [Actinorhabdospora filicis]|uniref:alpha/beta hydrolase n=1 Tax=Actinorhabdospora filicis TaxID=1785913 RepID=UPI002557A1A9|nr:alpha/beta hydrolase [Actinorhabdospora filicis]
MTQANPPWVAPFVLDTPEVTRERVGHYDLYLPEPTPLSETGPRPAVIMLHGGPVNPAWPASPRDWLGYRGLGAQIASRGYVGVVVDHGLHSFGHYPQAWADCRAAIDAVRADPRVDGDRIVVWVFSGGGPFVVPLHTERVEGLRAVALTYPLLAHPELAEGFDVLDAIDALGALPLIFTRVGLEHPPLVDGQEKFLAAAAERDFELDLIDVPNGHHGFEQIDHTEESREALERAFELIFARLA